MYPSGDTISEQYNIAIYGTGSIGQRYMRLCRDMYPSANIDLYRHKFSLILDIDHYNRTGVKIFDVEKKYNIRNVYYDIFDRVHEGYDFAFICTPTNTHTQLAMNLTHDAIPTLVEKPLYDAWNIKHCAPGIVPLYIGYQLRVDPHLSKVKTLLSSLGDIVQCNVTWTEAMSEAHPWEEDYKLGYAARRDLGGGVINCYSHEVDYIAHLFGYPKHIEPVSVNYNDHLPVEDEVLANLFYEPQGFKVKLYLDFSSNVEFPMRYLTIQGSKGILFWNILDNVISVKYKDKPVDLTLHHTLSKDQLFIDMISSLALSSQGIPSSRLATIADAEIVRNVCNAIIERQKDTDNR